MKRAAAKPASYREDRRRCPECQHCYVFWQHESQDRFFCCFQAPRRPRSDSSAHGESFLDDFFWKLDEKTRWRRADRREAAWKKWSRNREVSAYGGCECFLARFA